MESMELIDAWREFFPDRFGYTWHRRLPNVLHERLDWFMISEEIFQSVINLEVILGHRTDHSLVVMEIYFQSSQRGPGFWKMNNALLEDRDYIEGMNKLLDFELEQKHLYKSYRQHWEVMKQGIRTSTMQFASNRQRSRKNKLVVLEKKLKNCQIEEYGLFTDRHDMIRKLKDEIEEIYAYRAQGAMIRTKVRWQEHGQKPTSYF